MKTIQRSALSIRKLAVHRPGAGARDVDRKGATTVEFALVVPVVFLILFGAVEFARVSQVSNAAAFAAFQGCRQGIITGGTSSGVTTATQNVLNSMSITGATITVTPSTITSQTTAVTVVVAVPMDRNTWIVPKFTNSQTITRGCTMTCQGAVPSNVALPSYTPVTQPLPPVTTSTLTTAGTGTSTTGSPGSTPSNPGSTTSGSSSSGSSSSGSSKSGSTGSSSSGSGTTGSGSGSGTKTSGSTGSKSSGTSSSGSSGSGSSSSGTSKTSGSGSGSSTPGSSGSSTSGSGSSSSSSNSSPPTLLY